MTGTAKTEVEFEKTYKLETTIGPRPVRARQDWADQVYKTETAKWRAVANETAEIHKKGARLVGTTSVEKANCSVPYWRNKNPNLLNAKPENVERESEIVAQAGRAGAVTIATNMAGQGTDIILGSNSDYMARLKLQEMLLGRLVKPEVDHKPWCLSAKIAAPGVLLMPPPQRCPAAASAFIPVPCATPIRPWASWP